MSVQSDVTLKTYFETGDVPTEAQFINTIDSKGHVNKDITLGLNLGTTTITVFAGKVLEWIGIKSNGANTVKIGTTGVGSEDVLPERSLANNDEIGVRTDIWANGSNVTLYLTATDVDVHLKEFASTPLT